MSHAGCSPPCAQPGFTLLEVTVALAISALLLAATYSLVAGAVDHRALLEARGAELRDFYRFKRSLRKDVHAMLTDASDPLSAEEGTLTLRCRGDVLFGQGLGARVLVRYRWGAAGDGAGATLERAVFGPDGRELEPAWRVRLAEDLVGIDYEVSDGGGWAAPGSVPAASVRAMRWRLEYRHIGSWQFIQPISPSNDA